MGIKVVFIRSDVNPLCDEHLVAINEYFLPKTLDTDLTKRHKMVTLFFHLFLQDVQLPFSLRIFGVIQIIYINFRIGLAR